MKKIILFVILGITIIFAGVKLFSKPKNKRPTAAAVRSSRKTGKTIGQIKPKTAEEIAAEKKKAKIEERSRKRENQRTEKATQRLVTSGYRNQTRDKGRSRRGAIGTTRIRKGVRELYQLRAIFTVDNVNYALIDNRQVKKGDEIMGRQIVDILNDRIIVNESGKNKEVKIGESAFPNLITQTRRTRS